MKIKNNPKIKVRRSVTPIHFKLRKEPPLTIGGDYYVSFGMNQAIPYVLLEVIDNGKGDWKTIRIGIKNNSSEGYGDSKQVYSDEIGLTQEGSVINTRTS